MRFSTYWNGAATNRRGSLQALGKRGLITHIGIEVRPPGTMTEAAHHTMTLFAREVMPVLKAEAAKRGI